MMFIFFYTFVLHFLNKSLHFSPFFTFLVYISKNKKYNFDKKDDDSEEKENTLQEAIKRIAKAKKVFLRGKRIK